jgi:hypothetical protein
VPIEPIDVEATNLQRLNDTPNFGVERMKAALSQATSPSAPTRAALGRVLQRKCSCGSHAAGGECEECKKKRQSLQRNAGGHARPAHAPAVVDEVLGSAGQPLDAETRLHMESRFRRDFSRVRVHTDARAVASADAVEADAYTVGPQIVFAAGRYAPRTTCGRALLTHELAHVVQQEGLPRGSGPLAIDPSPSLEMEAARMASRDPSSIAPSIGRVAQLGLQRAHCSRAGTTCAATTECDSPDPGYPGSPATASSWALVVNIDVEASDFESALRSGDVGHTYVALSDGSGKRFTYGFYPAGAVPNENKREVPGCVHHPDLSHAACIDDRVMYNLSLAQYNAALAAAQGVCKSPPLYGVRYTCTTFADVVTRAAGQTLPSSTSEPTTIYMQSVPSIDNPNTLSENVQKERNATSPPRSPFWNDPCRNRCEASFDACVKRSRMGGMDCLPPRQRCYERCPAPGAAGASR